jgi:glycosyltransferase involved in cell wall biosynthesis
MLRACLVCLPAASVVDPRLGGPIGGTETRAWLFARLLARRGDTAVTFVVRHHEPLRSPVEGVSVSTHVDRVFRLFEQVGQSIERRPGFPWLRLRQWRWPLVWQFPAAVAVRFLRPRRNPKQPDRRFSQIAADVFCTFGVQTTSATVIASAHAQGRPAVLVLGSDGDLDERFLGNPDFINPYGDRARDCRFILEQADVIVCQTQHQQRLLKERFGRDGVIIANPIDLDEFDRLAAEPSPIAIGPSRPVLWIGRAENIHKRPMEAIQIARLCPELPFLLVMNPRDPAEEARVRNAAPGNVTILDHVPPPQMPALFASSLALLNTSSLEGFPNTFLQAAAAGIPVVSLEVGDEYLRASQGGVWCERSLEAAAAAIRTHVCNETARTETGRRGRAWVREHHDAKIQADKLHRVLANAVIAPPRTA